MKIKAISFLLALFLPLSLLASSGPCPLSHGINVQTSKRMLTICKKGQVVKRFDVAIGYNGVGKKHAGDNKTPIGLYGLAHPRRSSKFKIFIPILYPTSRQLASGYTGRDVGIHGPSQTSPLGLFNNLPRATRGCIAVGKNNYIEYVAHWIQENPGAKILII